MRFLAAPIVIFHLWFFLKAEVEQERLGYKHIGQAD